MDSDFGLGFGIGFGIGFLLSSKWGLNGTLKLLVVDPVSASFGGKFLVIV